MTTLEHLEHPFGPLYDETSRVLILGSFPSVISRQQNFYYANPQNRFWLVLSAVFEDPAGQTSAQRAAFARRHHLALWDVIASCSIHASSDASIQDVKVNAIGELVKKTRIRVICTTGGKASTLYQKYVEVPLPHIALPSTSGANARMSLERLVQEYACIRTYAEED